MKTSQQLQFTRAVRLRGTFLVVVAVCLAVGIASIHAAQPSVQPLLQSKWPAWPRGFARDAKVMGNYAYVALNKAGLQVIDVRNPTNCVRVGGYDTGQASSVAVVAGRIYVADYVTGLLVLPTLPNVQFTVRVNATPAGCSPWRPPPTW